MHHEFYKQNSNFAALFPQVHSSDKRIKVACFEAKTHDLFAVRQPQSHRM